MPFAPHYWTSVVGSFPNRDAAALSQRLVGTLDVPDWPQLPRRSFRESMYVQYSVPLPGIVVDETREKVYFDTTRDLTPELETFYERYLADDVDAFRLQPEFAQGFFTMLEALRAAGGTETGWVKGQVTGPVSFGLTVTDQDLRASLYDERLADAIVKNTAMSARWQARQLKALGLETFLFVDEPYMASFGSAFISLSREGVMGMLDEVFEAIHQEGALAGVHCCGNTDWSVLLSTQVDILNLDAFGFIDNLALYPAELRFFLDRGGILAWGLAPNNEGIQRVTPEGLARHLQAGIENICTRAAARGVAIAPEEFTHRSLVLPACGLGSTTPEVADQVLKVLGETRDILRQGM